MLLLSRRRDERIVIERGDERIVLLCVEIGRQKVKIGIEADEEWRILREELLLDAGVPASGVLDTAH